MVAPRSPFHQPLSPQSNPGPHVPQRAKKQAAGASTHIPPALQTPSTAVLGFPWIIPDHVPRDQGRGLPPPPVH